MKRIVLIVLSILIIIPSSVALAADGYEPPLDKVAKEDVYRFADELKQIYLKNYNVSYRLIVGADKAIDYMDAIDSATGIDGLYVLQFSNADAADRAYKYYKSLSYVNYVEYDKTQQGSAACSIKDYNYVPQCFSTVNSYIDDAIKLANRLQNGNLPEIRVGVADSGITGTFLGRVVGGYNFVENSSFFVDVFGHGTKVTGVITLNTPDNVKVLGYKVLTNDGEQISNSAYAALLYMAVADECKVLNCSFTIGGYSEAIQQAVYYAAAHGCILVGSAGNDGENIGNYPGKFDKAICVGAATASNTIADFSNFGEDVDIYAAGYGNKFQIDGGGIMNSFSGTSAASPVVASICAVLLSADPEYTPEQLKDAIICTGYSSNEENINEKGRLIANAYEALKYLSKSELPQVSLSYQITRNPKTGYADISFTSDDDATIYYYLPKDSLFDIPYYDQGNLMPNIKSYYKYEKGTTVSIDSSPFTITVCAYAPGKAKSAVEYISAPPFSDECGYSLKKADLVQKYNMINNYQLNEKTVIVPSQIDGCEIQQIGSYCFMGNLTVETIIIPESVKQIDAWAFANCHNLKTVIAPGVEACGMYAFFDCINLENVDMPNLKSVNVGMFKNCAKLETAKLGALSEIDNQAFYGCESLKLVKTTEDDISFAANTFNDCNNLTIATPDGSAMQAYANENHIALLGEITANGGSIRLTDAGLRFGYRYCGEYNPNIEEYGFVYNSGEVDDLTVDNSLRLVANNRIDHGSFITYNLVFINVPYTEKAFSQMISAKAYIKIGGEYFYSDVVQHSYNSVAEAILNDDTMPNDIKDRINDILSKVA